MTVQELINGLRSRLAPKTGALIVKLQLKNHGYVPHELVAAAIDQLEKRMLLPADLLGQVTPLEKLGILLLTESE